MLSGRRIKLDFQDRLELYGRKCLDECLVLREVEHEDITEGNYPREGLSNVNRGVNIHNGYLCRTS
jgi:hypothetical protein